MEGAYEELREFYRVVGENPQLLLVTAAQMVDLKDDLFTGIVQAIHWEPMVNKTLPVPTNEELSRLPKQECLMGIPIKTIPNKFMLNKEQ